MHKLIDIEQKVTNVGKGCGDIKAVCPETHVHHALAPSHGLAESERLDNLTQTATMLCERSHSPIAINMEVAKTHDAEKTLQEGDAVMGQVSRDKDSPAVSTGDVIINHAPGGEFLVPDTTLNSAVGSTSEALNDHTPLLTFDSASPDHVLQAASATTEASPPELQPSDFSIAITMPPAMPTPSCMSLAGASETVPKDKTLSQQQRSLCKHASKDQLSSEAAKSCGLSIPAEDATTDVKDFRSLMNVPGVDGHSDPKPDTVNSDNNNITLHVHVNDLGKENQDHLTNLTYKELKKLLKLTPDHETLMAMIRFIHLHEQHPENRNVRLTNEDDVAEVKRKGRWLKENSDQAIYDVISRNCLRFIDVSDTLEKGMQKAKHGALTEYLEMAEDMANKENADLHADRFEFKDLLSRAEAAFSKET